MKERVVAGGGSTSSGGAAPLRTWMCALMTLVLLAVSASPALGKPSPYLATDRSLINSYAAIEAAKLGVVLPGGSASFITLKENSASVIPGPEPAYATTDCRDSGGAQTGPATGCVIEIAVLAHKNGELRATIAHEVFHVFQVVMSGSLANFYRTPRKDWLIEGSAIWVESVLVPNRPDQRGFWRTYLGSPPVELFARTYTAVGFFGHMAQVGISPWTKFKAMFAADSSDAAYAAAVGGNTKFLDSEGSVFFREPTFGSAWNAQGPSVPTKAEVHYEPTTVTITSTTRPLSLDTKPYADDAYSLSIGGLPKDTLVELVVRSGHVRLRATAGSSTEVVNPSRVLLCSDPSGCNCPGPIHYIRLQRGDLGVAGGPSGAVVTLTRTPCDTLLAAPPCEGLLPGFTQPTHTLLGSPLSATVSAPKGGSSATTCALLAKGSEVLVTHPAVFGPEGEETPAVQELKFEGVVAWLVSIERASTIEGAVMGFKILTSGIAGEHIEEVGDEAILYTTQGAGPEGLEYGAIGLVRVHNLIVDFGISSTPGNYEASPPGARALLAQVAGKL